VGVQLSQVVPRHVVGAGVQPVGEVGPLGELEPEPLVDVGEQSEPEVLIYEVAGAFEAAVASTFEAG
jgi:hypothetical protein